ILLRAGIWHDVQEEDDGVRAAAMKRAEAGDSGEEVVKPRLAPNVANQIRRGDCRTMNCRTLVFRQPIVGSERLRFCVGDIVAERGQTLFFGDVDEPLTIRILAGPTPGNLQIETLVQLN